MKYLIVTDDHEPFYTDWFTFENSWIENCNMIVFDLKNYWHSIDGKTWVKTKEDYL